jgi:hypothetical protein
MPIKATSRRTMWLCALITSALICSTATAQVINVPGDQPTIQAGIDAAVDGDTVLVAPGTYFQTLNFNGKAITVTSASGPGGTIISGTGQNTSIVKFITGEGPASVLQGFMLTNGAGTADAQGIRRGGAIYASSSSPTIIDCLIVNNVITGGPPAVCPSSFGGGVFLDGGPMTLIECFFNENSSRGSFGNGGGMYATNATPLLINCRFVLNGASSTIGCVGQGSGHGGGLNASGGTLINCEFLQNSSSGSTLMGGSSSGGGAVGGSLFINCLFRGNSTSSGNPRGGGLSTTGTLVNCTVTNNSLGGSVPINSAGGVDSQPIIMNCIVFGNTNLEVSTIGTALYSCIEGGFPGTGNIDADPLFVNAATGDFHLQDASPCRDTGDRTLLPADSQDLDGDGNTLETLSRDLDLNRRIVNGEVDMGAYEWQHACVTDVSPSSPGVAGNGIINIDDLLTIINGWGTCDQCIADIDGDDDVDIDDLLAVINGWGACK